MNEMVPLVGEGCSTSALCGHIINFLAPYPKVLATSTMWLHNDYCAELSKKSEISQFLIDLLYFAPSVEVRPGYIPG